jgi:nucleotide-binding universal stress UspA family protein
MAIKRILLPFCDNGDVKAVAEAAFHLGHLLSAQVRGLLARRPYSFLPTLGEPLSPEMIELLAEHEQRSKAESFRRAQVMFQDLEARFPHVDTQWNAADGSIRDLVGHSAKLADISLLGSGPQFEENGWEEIREAALLGSGRPILLVPSTGIETASFERVVIAWKESIEAARAIGAADPFLMLAKEVYLVSVGENAEEASASLQQVESYLQLHFAELRSEVTVPPDKNTGEILISTCEARGHALLVMGAYSHWRWQERVFGGVTDYVLREARTPVLMAH